MGADMASALASHQCGPGSIPGVDAICGLNLLLVLLLAPRGFSPGTPVFLPPQKPTFPNFNSTLKQWRNEEPLCGCANEIPIYMKTLKMLIKMRHRKVLKTLNLSYTMLLVQGRTSIPGSQSIVVKCTTAIFFPYDKLRSDLTGDENRAHCLLCMCTSV